MPTATQVLPQLVFNGANTMEGLFVSFLRIPSGVNSNAGIRLWKCSSAVRRHTTEFSDAEGSFLDRYKNQVVCCVENGMARTCMFVHLLQLVLAKRRWNVKSEGPTLRLVPQAFNANAVVLDSLFDLNFCLRSFYFYSKVKVECGTTRT